MERGDTVISENVIIGKINIKHKSLLKLNLNICKCPKTMKRSRTDYTKLVRSYPNYIIKPRSEWWEVRRKLLNISFKKTLKKGCHYLLHENSL